MIEFASSAMAYINQHSFTLTVAAAMLALGIVLLRDGFQVTDLVPLGALALGFGLAYLLFRPGSSTMSAMQEVRQAIGAGVPVLLEYQSPY